MNHMASGFTLLVQPHFIQATIKAVYAAWYLLPTRKCLAVKGVQDWLRKWAYGEGDKYTSWTPLGCADLRVYEVVWNDDWEALERIRQQSYPEAVCVPSGNRS